MSQAKLSYPSLVRKGLQHYLIMYMSQFAIFLFRSCLR